VNESEASEKNWNKAEFMQAIIACEFCYKIWWRCIHSMTVLFTNETT